MINNNAVNNQFHTDCRKLEQFLFVHDIFHKTFYKNDEGMTVWVYDNCPELFETVAEYREIVKRRQMRRLNERRM